MNQMAQFSHHSPGTLSRVIGDRLVRVVLYDKIASQGSSLPQFIFLPRPTIAQ